jgi:TraM recognition site of TraD and TraG
MIPYWNRWLIIWNQLPYEHRWLVAGIVAGLFALLGLLYLRYRAKADSPPEGVVMWLTPTDPLTIRQCREGVFAIGVIGGGKSSTLEHLQAALMKRGTGMLILTAAASDFAQVSKVAKRCGREEDLRRFAPDEAYRFDFLNFELCSVGGSIATAGQLLQDLVDFSSRSSSQNVPDPFWPNSAGRLMRMAMTLVYHARGKCSISDVYYFITSMASTAEARMTREFAESFCGKIMLEVAEKPATPDAEIAVDYVFSEWPGTGEKTQGNIRTQAMSAVEKFMSGHVRQLMSNGETNLSPQDILDGKIVVVDLPILRYRESGQFCQLVWKVMTQRAVLRREPNESNRDIVLWIDEAQLTAIPSVDSMTQAVARKHGLIQVAITQNLPLLFATLKNRDDAIAWVSNLSTKYVFSNNDRETNEYFSAMAGERRELLGTCSVSNKPYDLWADVTGASDEANYSMAEQIQPEIRPAEFLRFRKGGPENDCVVDCIVFQSGRIWSNGKSWIKASITQPKP